MALDWAFLKERGGGNLELLIATLLRREYPDVRQVNPDQGDGGIDLVREAPEGLYVWQVKDFVTAITPSQQRQIAKSWDRLHVRRGDKEIAEYALITPWTPTEPRVRWFRDLTAGAGFPCKWDAAAFLNGLAAAHPDVIALFEKGSAAFDDFIVGKALVAGTALRDAPETMRDAIKIAEGALRDIRDSLSEHYLINVSERTSGVAGELPTPGAGETAVMHRMEYLGHDRWRVESVVPKHPDAIKLDPIGGTVHFSAEPGTPEAEQLKEFMTWGVPLKDFAAEVETRGGPFSNPRQPSSLSIGVVGNDQEWPDLVLRVLAPGDQEVASQHLRVREVTRGVTGGGLRVVSSSFFGTTRVELRFASSVADDEFNLSFPPTPGLRPRQVTHELTWLAHLPDADTLVLEIADHVAGVIKAFDPPGAGTLAREIALRLEMLQHHTEHDLLMPNVMEITQEQIDELVRLASIYDGHPESGTWSEALLRFEDSPPVEALPGTGAIVMVAQPVLTLGQTEYPITHQLATTYLSAALAPEFDISSFTPGDEVRLIPGEDNRVTIAPIVDDTAPDVAT